MKRYKKLRLGIGMRGCQKNKYYVYKNHGQWKRPYF